jgi:hypothetical protein
VPPYVTLTYTGAEVREVLSADHFVHVVAEQNLDKEQFGPIRRPVCRVKVDK